MGNTLSVLPVPPATALQAAAADIVTAAGSITITNMQAFNFVDAPSLSATATVAETVQVTTLTPVAANSSTYTFAVNQYDIANDKMITATFSYTSLPAGDTATTICNAFRAMMPLNTNVQITPSGAATLILTAITRYPIFTITITATGGGFTQATGTPGVRSVGLAADVALAYTKAGLTAPTGLAAAYTTYKLKYTQNATPELGNVTRDSLNSHTLYVSTSATNYAAFAARMVEVMAAYAAGGTTSDPLLLAKPTS